MNEMLPIKDGDHAEDVMNRLNNTISVANLFRDWDKGFVDGTTYGLKYNAADNKFVFTPLT
jgi:hypothetical protein